MQLVLSLFPGIGLLDLAFEDAGFCVVRGPDLIWGGDSQAFTPPAGKFNGIIGGPPCKRWSRLANVVRAVHGEEALAPDLIPDYERIVAAAKPEWFIMENVPGAPAPAVDGYLVHETVLNNRHVGGIQNRVRRFSFGTSDGRPLHIKTNVFEPIDYAHAVTTNSGGRRAVVVKDKNGRLRGGQGKSDDARLKYMAIEDMAELQGLPRDYLADCPLTVQGKRTAIGNGVPLPMGQAVARAVVEAVQ